MNVWKQCRIALLMVGLIPVAAMGDGMIVPVRPEIRVRGHWAVKYHHVSIQVRDQVAFVTIDQEFVNTGQGAIEVEYLFPVPPDAAIDAMTLVVNGKEYAAQLLEADKARKIYEDIVRQKKDPALLEYAGFGLYKTRAFPLEPGKPARVVVNYKNVCKRDHNLTEVWYPLNTEKFSARPIEDVEIKVDIKAASDITAVYSPTHDLSVKRKGDRHVIATYHATKTLPIADFQAFYKTGDEAVGATLLTYQPYKDKDGYFLLLVSPNPRSGETKVVPKDMVLVLDRSGSMGGKKLDQARDALEYILRHLNDADRFNVIAYGDDVDPFFDGIVPVNRKNRDEALGTLDRLEAAGGTNIHDALATAMKMLSDARSGGKDAHRPCYVIFLTDGLATVGKTTEKEILTCTKETNKAGARLFAFGVGYDVNVRLLDKLVDENGGKSDYVKPKEPVEGKITSLYNKIKNPVMMNLTVRVDHLRIRDMYPRELGDLFDGDQIVLVGRYDARDAASLAGDGDTRKTNFVIKGTYENRERAFEYPVSLRPSGRNLRFEFVEKLWAIRRVGYLLDQIQLHGKSKELIDELVRLSRDYGIMTPYTSFLAEETTRLGDRGRVYRAAGTATERLRDHTGVSGQMGAMNRQAMKTGESLPGPAPSGLAKGGSGYAYDSTPMLGNASKDAYEKGESEHVRGVRQIGNQAMYRRGKVWIASNAADVDLEKHRDQIREITRFGEEYFKLAKGNSAAENQILATQGENEELVIRLRGQVYRIK